MTCTRLCGLVQRRLGFVKGRIASKETHMKEAFLQTSKDKDLG